MDNEQNITLEEATFSFKGIELLRGSLHYPPQVNTQLTNFTYELAVENQIDSVQKLIFVIVKIRISCSESKEPVGALDVSCIYEIINFPDVIKLNPDGKWSVPKTLSDTLNSVSISTTRGVMFSTFKGTFLHNAILPIIDPSALHLEK
jgi:hypothetical protein|nr:hypothetical protein [uncultured Sediminibacterium sp.]